MSSVTAEEMRQIEETAFSRGVDAGELMDQAGAGIARLILDYFPHPGRAVAFIGKGNNGGDALVVLEHLRAHGWQVSFRAGYPETEWSVLSRQRRRRLALDPSDAEEAVPAGRGPLLLLDGLLGIGVSGELRAPLDKLASEMEELRHHHGAVVAAIDLPSGLNADDGSNGAVVADLTLTIGVPKTGLLADRAAEYCGRLFIVELENLPAPQREGILVATPSSLPGLLKPRAHDFHKGKAGRVCILAGSSTMSGAAILASCGAIRGGAGLVTLFLDPENPAQPPAEIITRRQGDRISALFQETANARVIGPGLGTLTKPQGETLREKLASDDTPTVLDADALNFLAESNQVDQLRSNHLITPHPGEFARLAPDLADLPRAEAVKAFVERHPCTLLLKGTRTLVASPNHEITLNPTGHAGMATAGQGDVLAGVCGALLASGVPFHEAAALGAWLCGRAGERALTHGGESEQSCTAGDTVEHLGGAFRDWCERRR